MAYNSLYKITGECRMMDDQLTQRVINDLARHRSRNEIIRMVCEESSLNWSAAVQAVNQLEAEHAHTIARKQGPLMIFLSIGSLIVGAALLAYGAEFFMALFHGDALTAILSARSAYFRLAGSLTGLGMVIGGIIGLYDAFARYFET
jgi:hypothetical protein